MSMNAHHLAFGIVTYDRDKAEKKLHEVVQKITSSGDESIKVVCSKTDLFSTFKSGKTVMWINPAWQARGYRLHGAYVDTSLKGTEDFVNAVTVKWANMADAELYWF